MHFGHAMFGAISCALVTLSPAHAQTTVVLPKDTSGNVGFSITKGGWTETNNNHADASYRAFKRILNREPGKYDYYYQLRVAPQYPASQDWCSTGINVGSFFKSLFGVSEASLALMKASVNWEYDAGASYNYISVQSPILMMGTGSTASAISPGSGCYFDITPPFETPMLRYSGGGDNQDNFTFKFSVSGGKAISLNFVKTVFGLFNTFNAALSFATIKAGQQALVQTASEKFEAALAQAGSFNSSLSIVHEVSLRDRKDTRLQISVPDLFGRRAPSGNIIIYTRRSASILMDTSDKVLTPGSILSNERIALRQCGLEALTKGACSSAKPLRIALMEAVKPVDDKATLNIYNVNDAAAQKKVLALCEIVRTSLRDQFRLSVADEMLMRWALAKQSGLLDALNNPERLQALATANGTTPEQLLGACYNAGDETTVANLVAATGFERRN